MQSRINLLKELRRHLEYGDNKAIAKRTGFHDVYVSMCLSLNNDAYNEQIVDEAIKLINERNNRVTNQLKTVQSNFRQPGIG